MSDKNKNAVVLFDLAQWYDADGGRQSAAKGEEVSLPSKEFDRLEALGAVASPRSKEAKEAAENDPTAGEVAETDKPEEERAAHADPTQPPPEAPGGSQNPKGDGSPPDDESDQSKSKKG